ncbi:hypothetical protein N0V85_006499 [Neurospora sp. IMI 360204]|nr:hypothetical protein N0V85_006499 [Neurospora sp. IMI 360204]
MAISFWLSAFTAHIQRLAFPSIAAVIKEMTIAALSASSVAHVSISTEAFEIANILNTPQEFQTCSLIDSSQEVGLIGNIKKARHMKAIINTIIKDVTPTEVNETTHESNIVDNCKDTTQSTDDQATAPLSIEDTNSAQVAEVPRQVELIQNVDIITDDNRDATSSIADKDFSTIGENERHTCHHVFPTMDIIEVNDSMASSNDKHIYSHVLPTIDIIEVNSPMVSETTEIVDDMGASASSIGHNFERFLKEDKMQWVHAVANQPELCNAISNTKKQIAQVTKPSTRDHKPITADIKPLTDKKTENISTEEKVVDPEVFIVHHTRKLSNGTNSSIETDKTTDSDASNATTPDSPNTEYSTPDTSAIDNKFDDAAMSSNNQPKHAEDKKYPSAPVAASSFDNMYNYSHLPPSELEVTLIMERLDPNRRYVQMTCGYWYALEDDDEIRQMSKTEYQEFIEWTSQTPVITREEFDKKQQADAEQGIITSNAIAIIESMEDEEQTDAAKQDITESDEEDDSDNKPIELIDRDSTADQPQAGIELLDHTDPADEEDYYSSDPLAAWEATLAIWETTLAIWKDPSDIGEDWGVVGLFNYPDGQKQVVMGNDEQVYWMYEGMFRLLNAHELDQFNRWRDGDEHAFEEPEQKREPKTWVRAVLSKRRKTNKWCAWSLEMESIEEEDEGDVREEDELWW